MLYGGPTAATPPRGLPAVRPLRGAPGRPAHGESPAMRRWNLLLLCLAAGGCTSATAGVPPLWGRAAPDIHAPAADPNGLAARLADCLAHDAPLPPLAFVGNPFDQESASRELPAVDVTADRGNEETPVGPSGQPDWTLEVVKVQRFN